MVFLCILGDRRVLIPQALSTPGLAPLIFYRLNSVDSPLEFEFTFTEFSAHGSENAAATLLEMTNNTIV